MPNEPTFEQLRGQIVYFDNIGNLATSIMMSFAPESEIIQGEFLVCARLDERALYEETTLTRTISGRFPRLLTDRINFENGVTWGGTMNLRYWKQVVNVGRIHRSNRMP